jgi:DNA-binding transcriptional MocR family regulator
MSTGGNTVLSQMMIAEFLEHGGYDLHLRKIRRTYVAQIQRITQAISRYFPEKTKVTRPKGGHVVWVELPPQVDALELNRKALGEKISIIPGPVFSPTKRYRQFIRLNAAIVWSDRIESSLMILGRLASELIKSHPGRTH